MESPANKHLTAAHKTPRAYRPTAGMTRRLVSIAYELLLIFTIAFCSGLIFPGATDAPLPLTQRFAFQAYLLFVFGLYLVPCWRVGGQTLPMKAWHLRVERVSGERLELWRAILRYLLACVSILAFGLGYVWAFVDRDGQFLHDRLAGTRIVRCA